MKRILEFDAIRGLAALAIIVNHIWFPSVVPLTAGVYLFFVLSGFLITSIIIKNLHKPNFLIAFYGRRSLRIWPIYYIALIVVIIFNFISPGPEPLEGLPYFLTYTQNIQEYWFGIAPPFIHGFQHTWTLAIEENFYLFWPLLIYVFGPRAILPLSMIVVAGSVAARGLGFGHFILLTQADGLGLGSLLAMTFAGTNRQAGHRSRLHLMLGSVALLAVAFAAIGPRLMAILSLGTPVWAASFKLFSINVFFFATVGLINLHAGAWCLKPLRWPALVYLGEISYGLYLYHYIILCSARILMESAGIQPAWWNNLALFAASLCTAACSWKWIESQILKYKDCFKYDPSPKPVNNSN